MSQTAWWHLREEIVATIFILILVTIWWAIPLVSRLLLAHLLTDAIDLAVLQADSPIVRQ